MNESRPRLRPFGRSDVRAQTGVEASAFDVRAIDVVGVPQPVLMENAGRSAAQVAARLFAPRRVTGLVGGGNNGGDALVALRTLAAWGAEATAVLVADRPADDPLLHGWSVEVVGDGALDEPGWESLWARSDVVIDGVLGTGVRGAPRERQAAVIRRMNACGVPVVSLDVPSGVDATTGAVRGVAVQAEVTVSFGAPKTGALLHPARAHAGRHVTVEIGFPPLAEADASGIVATPAWARARLPRRGTDTHKNRVGRVLVVGGSLGMAGAAVLSARAAFRAGAGLVRVATAPENREVVQCTLPDAIHVGFAADALEDAVRASDAVAVGPGLGTDDDAAEVLGRVTAAAACPVVLDADALNLAAAGRADLPELARRVPLLLTPHPGEMARLLPDVPQDAARLDVLDGAVQAFGCCVLLKGAPSLVGAPEAPVVFDTQSSSDLAVAGMGDTLTGACVALAAQGLALRDAAAVGLYLTGRAAALAGLGAGLTPSDVLERLPEALAESGPATSELDLPFVIFDADPVR